MVPDRRCTTDPHLGFGIGASIALPTIGVSVVAVVAPIMWHLYVRSHSDGPEWLWILVVIAIGIMCFPLGIRIGEVTRSKAKARVNAALAPYGLKMTWRDEIIPIDGGEIGSPWTAINPYLKAPIETQLGFKHAIQGLFPPTYKGSFKSPIKNPEALFYH